MDINRNNYEEYIIDYLDGKLNPVQTAELMYFFSQNPDLELEFNVFENYKLPESKLKFNNKEELKKAYSDFPEVTDSNFDEFCVAEIEGELDDKSRNRLYEYLKRNPEKNRDLELYQKTILIPDESLVFPGLNNLKKHKTIPFVSFRSIYYQGIAAAAILAVVLTIIFRRSPEPVLISDSMAENETNVKNTEHVTAKTITKQIPPVETVVASESSTAETEVSKETHIKSLKDHYKNSGQNDIISSASSNDIEETSIQIRPILISKINHSPYPADLALLGKKPPVQSDAEPKVKPEKSLAESLRERFRATEIFKSADNFNAWNLAQASLKGINYLTESDIQISRKVNEEGQISKLSIESESFGFSAPLKK
jgi:hypothetical protein